ncbi:MAG: hypothetical protein H7222_02685 [Methylotenera sp.]|nr:hypothetical protein [Oligoflexia bacterium]
MATTASLRDDFRKDGYDREEEYFHRLNRDLIERQNQHLSLIQSTGTTTHQEGREIESSDPGWVSSLLSRLEKAFKSREKPPGLF